MCHRVILLVAVTVLHISTTFGTHSDFIAVSTTQSPNIETQCGVCQKVGEHNYRLAAVESQITQIRKELEAEKKHSEKLEKSLDEKQKLIQEMNKKFNGENDRIIFTNESLPRNCKEVMQRGNHVSGTYPIRPKSKTFKAFCEMNTRGGGWTVFQKRVDGSQDFYLYWADFKNGFGNFYREFWLGLDHVHDLTGDNDNQLLVELTELGGKNVYAQYYSFVVGNEEEKYALKLISGYEGDAGDSLSYHLGHGFSTRDRDNDAHQTVHCATTYTGAWWHNSCLLSNLNGRYLKMPMEEKDRYKGVVWRAVHGGNYSFPAVRMMVRPR